MKSTTVLLVLFTFFSCDCARVGYKKMPEYTHKSLFGVTPKHADKCYEKETRMATDGCNQCSCDLITQSFICTTKVCHYNTRTIIGNGGSCYFPGAVHIGRNAMSCRCHIKGYLYHCITLKMTQSI